MNLILSVSGIRTYCTFIIRRLYNITTVDTKSTQHILYTISHNKQQP